MKVLVGGFSVAWKNSEAEASFKVVARWQWVSADSRMRAQGDLAERHPCITVSAGANYAGVSKLPALSIILV